MGGTSSNGSVVSDTGVSITLNWQAPSTNADGSSLTDLGGYNVYYGTSPGTYTNSIDAGNSTMVTIDNLQHGMIYIAVTAYDYSGNESGYSEEISAEI